MSKFLISAVIVIIVMIAGCSDPYSGTQQQSITSQPLFAYGDTNAGRHTIITTEGCTIKYFVDGRQMTLEAQAFKMNGEERGVQTDLSGVAISIEGLVAGPYEVDLFTNQKKVGIAMMDINMDGSCSRFSTILISH